MNRAVTVGALFSGMGAHSFNLFWKNMDLPGLNKSSLTAHANNMHKELDRIRDHIFHRAASIICQESANLNKLELTEDTIVHNISVSYDGSWMKRGHTCIVLTLGKKSIRLNADKLGEQLEIWRQMLQRQFGKDL